MATLQERLDSLIGAIGADIKALWAGVGAALAAGNAAYAAAVDYATDLAATKLDTPTGTADSTTLARGDGIYANAVAGDFGVGGSTNYSEASWGRVASVYGSPTAVFEVASDQAVANATLGGLIGTSTANNTGYKRLCEVRFFLTGGSTAGQYGGGIGLLTRTRDATTTPGIRVAITDQGNVNIGTLSTTSEGFGDSYGGGAGVLRMKNAAVVPSSNPSGSALLYADGGDLKTRTPSGNVVTVAADAPPAVAGSRGGNSALASLLTALAARGLIVDSTS